MARILQNLSAAWQRLGLIQRVVLVGVVLACLAAGGLLLGWARRPTLAMLYSGLDAEDASKIVEHLRDQDVPFELADGGTTVKVPVDKVYSVRLEMASRGLPGGQEAGYRILDEEKIGTSPFAQRVNYARAIEGELAKTIRLLEGVTAARVHLVRPESPLFAGKAEGGSATVVLRMKPGWRPSAGNVAAVVHLVAGSVEHLAPEKVVVVDSRGRLLSGAGEHQGLAGRAGTFLDYKTQVEEYLADKAEGMLAAALGPNRATVKVNAVIDTSSVNETTEKFNPDEKVVTKEEITASSSNPPASAEGGATGETKEETTNTEYLVSRTVQQRTDLPGKITSLSVAAFVDLSPPESDQEGAPAGEAMTVQDVESIICNAIGLKEETDTWKVVETSFASKPVQADLAPPEPAGGWTSPDFLLEMARRFSLGILVLGALLALRMFRGGRKDDASAGELTGEQRPALAGGTGSPERALATASGEMDPEALRTHITNALENNPEEVKRLFLSWIDSEKGDA